MTYPRHEPWPPKAGGLLTEYARLLRMKHRGTGKGSAKYTGFEGEKMIRRVSIHRNWKGTTTAHRGRREYVSVRLRVRERVRVRGRGSGSGRGRGREQGGERERRERGRERGSEGERESGREGEREREGGRERESERRK